METKTLLPLYGCNRLLAVETGKALEGCAWVGVGFAGGMPELWHIEARTLVVNDKHEWIIHLASIAGDPKLGPKFWRRLRRVIFHPGVLLAAQYRCKTLRSSIGFELAQVKGEAERIDIAVEYFITAWMARNGTAGTKREFDAGFSIRWDAGGGDSAVRFHSACKAMVVFRDIARRCTFTCMDVFDWLDNCKDKTTKKAGKCGFYFDPPFIEEGESYTHEFPLAKHEELAKRLTDFKYARVVVRGYDCPDLRRLFPEKAGWVWNYFKGRDQNNKDDKPEVLLVKN